MLTRRARRSRSLYPVQVRDRRRLLAVPLIAGLALARPAVAAPNDPFYPQQWGLHVVHAADAHRVTTGGGVIVAVVDSGVDADHEDLRGRMLLGRDYVDDDGDAADANGHGTLVAGIIAARTGNAKGIASVAPGTKILPVRVLDEDGNGRSEDVHDGILWALDQGAAVINLSLAQDGDPTLGGLPGSALLRDQAVDDAIRQAAQRGATVVIAAGNDRSGGQSQTAYRASDDGVLVVGASTPTDARAAYSNYGSGLDLLAPGGGSAADPGDAGCTSSTSIVSTWWRADREDAYGGACGTSMSVAFVSAVAASLHALGKTNAEVADRIRATADDLGPKGRDLQTGYGRLNAARAVGARVEPVPSPSPRPTKRPPVALPSVRSQGSPAVAPSGRPSTSPSPKPSGSQDGRALGASDAGDEQRRAGLVSVAALAAGLATAGHVLRWRRVRRQMRGAS